ncbi:MAG: ABC transporter substrate-binding protein [Thermomicrobiales bacterium]|nr:ABC transporter substrate-binding protein [Thermomicrobiales bacterium]
MIVRAPNRGTAVSLSAAVNPDLRDPEWRRVLIQLTRREMLAGLGATAIIASGQRRSRAQANDATIEYAFADFTARLPRDPQRVVVLESRTGLDFALAADYPIIAALRDPRSPLDALLDPAVAALATSELDPDIEELLSYQPDLLVMGRGWWDYYQESDLLNVGDVPVLAVDDRDTANWRNLFTAQLALLERDDEAATAIAAYEATLANAREKIGNRMDDKTAAVVVLTETNWGIHWPDTLPVVLAQELGLDVITSSRAESATELEMFSPEELGRLQDIDLLIVQNLSTMPLAGLDLWKALPAVAAGHVIEHPFWANGGFAVTAGLYVDYLGDEISARLPAAATPVPA